MQLRNLLQIAAASLVLAACGDDVQPAIKSPSDAAAAQIKAIENNPNMSPEMKAATLQRLKQQSSVKDSLRTSASK